MVECDPGLRFCNFERAYIGFAAARVGFRGMSVCRRAVP